MYKLNWHSSHIYLHLVMSTNKSSDSKTKSIYDYVKKEKKEEDLIFENFDTEFQNLKR